MRVVSCESKLALYFNKPFGPVSPRRPFVLFDGGLNVLAAKTFLSRTPIHVSFLRTPGAPRRPERSEPIDDRALGHSLRLSAISSVQSTSHPGPAHSGSRSFSGDPQSALEMPFQSTSDPRPVHIRSWSIRFMISVHLFFSLRHSGM